MKKPGQRRPVRGSAVTICLVLGLLARPSRGLDPAKTIDQYSLGIWNAEDGLPQNSVQSIVQTRDGYVWLATQEGLARFDGIRFKVFDRANTGALSSNHIQALFESRDGSLWIGTYGSGLLRFRDREFTSYSAGSASVTITAITEDRTGTLWFSTGSDLFRFHGKGPTTFLSPGSLPGLVSCLAADDAGDLFIGTSGGLARLHDGALTTLTVKDGLSHNVVTALLPDRRGGLWIGTADGLNHLESGHLSRYAEAQGLANAFVHALALDRDGNLWVGTNGGLHRFRDGRFLSFTTREGLSSNAVTALREDGQGGLWVGTDGGGVNLLRDGSFIGYRSNHGLSSNVIYCVTGDRAGGLWTGTYDGEVDHVMRERIVPVGLRGRLRGAQVRALYQDAAGVLWIGTDLGLYRYENGRASHFTMRDGLGSDVVRVIASDAAGDLWLGTDGGGISRWADGRFITLTERDGLAGNRVRALLAGRDGALWIGTYGGLSRFSGGRFTTFSTREGLSSNLVRCLHEDTGGVLWIGTYGGGLNRLKDGRILFLTTREGLFSDAVYQILEDGRGDLWMSCNRGVYRVGRREIESFAAGGAASIHPTVFGRTDGMPSSECNGGSPAGWKQPDGTLWFPTLGGLARVDPSMLKTNPLPPSVVLEEALVDGRPLDLRQSGHLPAGSRRLEFDYAAIDFVAPEKVTFACKLEGFDSGWVSVGRQRAAHYTGLPPGRYTFRVIAQNGDGVWNRTGVSYSYEMAPYFFQTRLFEALCLFAALTLGWGAYRFRVRGLRKREGELRERVDAAVAHIKTLSGLLPICASCKNVRDDQGYWSQIESYVRDHSQAEFTHSICPECMRKLYPEYADLSEAQTKEP